MRVRNLEELWPSSNQDIKGPRTFQEAGLYIAKQNDDRRDRVIELLKIKTVINDIYQIERHIKNVSILVVVIHLTFYIYMCWPTGCELQAREI